jgi:hypothetical protein
MMSLIILFALDIIYKNFITHFNKNLKMAFHLKEVIITIIFLF